MGIRCCECSQIFERYHAENYAEDEGLDYQYHTCPDCLARAKKEAEKDAYIKKQDADLAALRAEVISLRKKLAASSTIDLTNDDDDDSDTNTKQPAIKKAKVSGTVWVIVKGDWPDRPHSQLVDVDVLGTYSTEEKAEAAMEDFIEEGGWMRGYGYHQGSSSESTIQIIAKTIDDPAE
eukprot:scaffold20605_cov110-Skeletonema_dohrnii-CCMP3373.AAC.12